MSKQQETKSKYLAQRQQKAIDKEESTTTNTTTAKPATQGFFLFERTNFILLGVGMLVVIIGFILMSGGGAISPNEFHPEEIFSPVRITVAPILVFIGFCVIGYSIFHVTKKEEKSIISLDKKQETYSTISLNKKED